MTRTTLSSLGYVSERVSILLSPQQRERLARCAAERGLPPSMALGDLVRFALDTDLWRGEAFYGWKREHGVRHFGSEGAAAVGTQLNLLAPAEGAGESQPL